MEFENGGGGADAGCLCSTLCNGLLPWGLAAAGLVLRVCLAANLAAAGPLQGRYTRPPF